MANNKEFLATIIEERHNWMLGCFPSRYRYLNLMELMLKTYNNQKALGEWDAVTMQTRLPKNKKNEGDTKFIALLSKFQETLKSKGIIGGSRENLEKKPGMAQSNKCQKKGGWKYCNPDNLEMMERNGKTWR
eukprot:7553104-Ditylum_brightwellii.AAC.1